MGFCRVPGLYKPLDGAKSRQMLTGIHRLQEGSTSPHLFSPTSAKRKLRWRESWLHIEISYVVHIWASLEPAGGVFGQQDQSRSWHLSPPNSSWRNPDSYPEKAGGKEGPATLRQPQNHALLPHP